MNPNVTKVKDTSRGSSLHQEQGASVAYQTQSLDQINRVKTVFYTKMDSIFFSGEGGKFSNVVIRKAQVPLLTTEVLFQAIIGEGFTPSRTVWPAVAGGDEPRPYEILSGFIAGSSKPEAQSKSSSSVAFSFHH